MEKERRRRGEENVKSDRGGDPCSVSQGQGQGSGMNCDNNNIARMNERPDD